ncbi:MAG: glycosyltransferase [Saprospiraceae bacterium]|nr:glycosyltransferase [Saprospiraceae bacterium]
MAWIGVIAIIVALMYLFVQLGLAYSWSQIGEQGSIPSSADLPLVTVLVPMRDEADHIAELLECLQKQDYPRFEVLCLDNHSSDHSVQVVDQFSDVRIRSISLDDHLREAETFKKEAIEFGVAQANADFILCTDADAILPPTWISTMMIGLLREGVAYVVGPVVIEADSSSFLADFQRLDYCGLLTLTGGGLQSRLLVSSFGPNHGYRKGSFMDVSGYDGNRTQRSGDDIFLVQKMVDAGYDVRFVKDRGALVRCEACTNWSSFWQQRIRWIGKAPSLSHLPSRLITLVPLLLSVALLVLVVLVFWHPRHWPFLLTAFLIKVVADSIVLLYGLRFTNQKFSLSAWILSHLFHPIYVWLVGLGAIFVRPRWKGRSI